MDIIVVPSRSREINRIHPREHQLECIVTDEKRVYEQLVAPLESQMIRTIWRVVRHPQLAEDTLQEALTTIWRKLERIQRHPHPRALILKICLNAAYDSLRRSKRSQRYKDPALIEKLPSSSKMTIPQDLERKEIKDEIHNAISQLPRKQAVAVLMRVVQDLPYEIIAQTMSCSEITARIHVSRGRKRLSQRLAHLLSTPSQEASE